MLTWMTTLPGHSYSLRENRPPTINKKQDSEESKEGPKVGVETALAEPSQITEEKEQNGNVINE